MGDLLNDYSEYTVNLGGAPVVFFYGSGLCLNRQPLRTPYSHSHYHNELFTVLKGEMHITTDTGVIDVHPGETAIIPANVNHTSTYSEGIFRVTVSFLDPEDQSAPHLKKLTEISSSGKISVYKDPHFADACEHLLKYVHSKLEFKDLLIKGCLTELCALICQAECSEQSSIKDTSESKNYRNYLIEAIFDNAFSPRSATADVPTLKDVSRQLHLSEKQTERTVKALYGRSFKDQILFMKMNKAAKLLESTDMATNAIASAVGYSVTRSFFASFKRQFGMTPGEYRTAKRNEKAN